MRRSREAAMSEVVDLTRRLERLERENRRWRLLAVVGGIGLAVVILTAKRLPSHAAKLVEGERLILRDSHGKTLAVLGVEADRSLGSAPFLTLHDSVGRVRAQLLFWTASHDGHRLRPPLEGVRGPNGQP
jgi:hypothetical protein